MEAEQHLIGFNHAEVGGMLASHGDLPEEVAGAIEQHHDQPIVSPTIAGLGFTVTALLIVLIGGVGTLQGAIVGAVVYRLLDFGLRRYMGESTSFVNGIVYVLIVLFLPYGIVGTWRLKSWGIKQGWGRLGRSIARTRPAQQ